MERHADGDHIRRRSPARRGGRNARVRSRSPGMIDRYLPNSRQRGDHYDSRGSHRERDDRRRPSSPAFMDGHDYDHRKQPIMRLNPLPNPVTLDLQVGFNWFAEWWRAEQAIKDDLAAEEDPGKNHDRTDRDSREGREKTRAQIQSAYDAYKDEFHVKMSRLFVQQHKDDEWFKERYIPELRDPIRDRLIAYRRELSSQWKDDIEAGVFDNFTLEGIYKSDSDGRGGIVDKEEGETIGATEVLGVGDLVASKGGDIRDNAAQQPALLIKTLAPTVSRGQIENLCGEALGDLDGGYKWLSLSDPNPSKKCHRIGWIILQSDDALPARRDDGRDGDDDTAMEHDAKTSTVEKALEAINGKSIEDPIRGSFTCHVGIHVNSPSPRKKALWDIFSAPERISCDLDLARRLVSKLDEEHGECFEGIEQVERRVEHLRQIGALQPVDRPEAVNGENSQDAEMEDGTVAEEVDDESLIIQKKELDLLVEYLRRVFSFCFFCVFECDSVHELIRKCPGGHLRRPRTSLGDLAKSVAKSSAAREPFPQAQKETSETNGDDSKAPSDSDKLISKNKTRTEQQLLRAFNWVKTFEDKILQILEPEAIDLIKIGGIDMKSGLDDELKKFMQQDGESKFRCKVPECIKIFKGESYWRKHVEKKHEEFFQNVVKNLKLVNAYVTDPAHIAPSRSDANSNGHFPTNTQHTSGATPRGFNLHGMQMMNGTLPNFGGANMMQFSGAPGAFPMAPGNWPFNTGSMFANGQGGHPGGPMRRGGGGNRYGNGGRSGPYDRRRGSMSGGGPSVMNTGNGMYGNSRRGGMGANTSTRWGDGAGTQAIGPREAVQGRTLKKYDDLDAVGGPSGAELNY